jgi:hypothetical protein
MTELKRKNDQINTVGIGWYGKWVLLHLIAAAISGISQARIIDAVMTGSVSSSVLTTWAVVRAALLIGITVYALPNPVRIGWVRWTTYAVIASFATAMLYGALSRNLDVQTYAMVQLGLNFLTGVLIAGTAQYLVLRNYVARAGWWYGVVAVAVSVSIGLSIMMNFIASIFVSQGLATLGTQTGITLFTTSFMESVIVGAGLWWLVANYAYTVGKKKKRDDLTTAEA